MGPERTLHPELLGDLAELSASELSRPLTEIASGPGSFGQLDEWTDWQHYLMPRLVPRSHEMWVNALLEILITGFMAVHPDGAEDQYPSFRQDVLDTLGRCLMDPDCWPNGGFNAFLCLNRYHVKRVDRWFWEEPSGKLSASLFLCLKYLAQDDVGAWMKSVLAIPNRRWRGQMLAWMVGAHGILTGELGQPSELDVFGSYGEANVAWAWSHGLSGNYSGRFDGQGAVSIFLPKHNRDAALAAIRATMTEDVFLGWLTTIAENPVLDAELSHVLSRFEELYLCD